MKLNKDDFVTITKNLHGIKINSVGIVKEITPDNLISVFFVGKRKELQLSDENLKYLDETKTGKPHKFKICNVCHILKEDFVDFEVNQTDSKGRKTTRPSCRDCRENIDGVSLKTSEKKKLDKIKPKHFFVCPICEKGSIPGITANLVKDHDHLTGDAREWLCDSCNTGLGRFKDDIELMEKAIRYLKKYSK